MRNQATPAEIRTALKTIPSWLKRGIHVHRTYEFPDFPTAIRFVTRVAKAAEKAQHHPDIDIRWNRVRLELTTHDAGGLTSSDFTLAQICDRLAV